MILAFELTNWKI